MDFPRISHDPAVMGGKPCIRELRISVGTVVGLIASGSSRERILQAYPQLEPADIGTSGTGSSWATKALLTSNPTKLAGAKAHRAA